MCGICDIENKAPVKVFTDEDYERVIDGVINKTLSVKHLDKTTYRKTATKLTEGVYSGYGKKIDDVMHGTPDYHMLFELRKNVHLFSGAKTYQQTRRLSVMLGDMMFEKERLATLKEFKDKAYTVLKNYNENYLTTEYYTAIAQATSARQWQQFEEEAELYPMLTYQTVGDGRVRPEHRALDGISRPIGDRFWSLYFPPNDWNCRCTVLQGDSGTEKTPLKGLKVSREDVPPLFRMNAGKDKIVFSKKHPYFDIAPKDKDDFKHNFGLPTQ